MSQQPAKGSEGGGGGGGMSDDVTILAKSEFLTLLLSQ